MTDLLYLGDAEFSTHQILWINLTEQHFNVTILFTDVLVDDD